METPDPLKDLEPTEPFVPRWLDVALQGMCDHPRIVALAVIAIALGAALL